MLGRTFNRVFAENPNFSPWGRGIRNLFHEGDLLLGNLETTLTRSDDPWPRKAFNFKLDPRYAGTLTEVPFKYLGIGNNHILDYKVPGMIETIGVLDRLGIEHAGAGLDLKEARRPAIIPLENGLLLHVIAAADHYEYWRAKQNRPGIWWFNLADPSNLIREVVQYARGLRPNDILMVSLHWGPNWEPKVSSEKRELARRLVEAGVKIVHGHSAHHLQPYELIGNAVVFYSMGDFIDDYAVDSQFRNDIGAIATLEIDSNGQISHLEVHPTLINDLRVDLL